MKGMGLILGGGGVRGLAHIGALKEIERMGLSFEAIAGCSIGSIIGAFYAAGRSAEEIESFVAQKRVHEFFDLSISKLGINRMTKLETLIEEFAKAKTFEELRIPFSVNATDLTTGRETIFSTGPLFPAIRASIAVPGVFAPPEINGKQYIDGGIVNQLPIAGMPSTVHKYVLINVSPFRKMLDKKDLSIISILDVSVRIAQNEVIRLRLKELPEKKYVLLEPDVAGWKLFEPERIFPEIVRKGEEAALERKEDLLHLYHQGEILERVKELFGA